MSQGVVLALLQLDPSRDAHWTSDGLPSLDAVRLLSGDDKISRQLVTNSAPMLRRANHAAWSVTAVEKEPKLPPVYPPEDAGLGAGPEGEDAEVEPVELMDEEVDRCKRELDRALRAKAKAEGDYARAERRLDEALERRTKAYPQQDPVTVAMDYVRSQHEQRMRAAGLNPGGAPSRLDLDMRGKRPTSAPTLRVAKGS